MKEEIAKLWSAALRTAHNSEVTQSQVHLRGADGSYCCLGILAEACGASWVGGESQVRTSKFFRMVPVRGEELLGSGRGFSSVYRSGFLSSSFLEECGVKDQTFFTELNKRHNFAQIADVIDKDWRTL